MLVLQDQEWLQIWVSALMHIARLMNSLAKGPKRMVTKVQWVPTHGPNKEKSAVKRGGVSAFCLSSCLVSGCPGRVGLVPVGLGALGRVFLAGPCLSLGLLFLPFLFPDKRRSKDLAPLQAPT